MSNGPGAGPTGQTPMMDILLATCGVKPRAPEARCPVLVSPLCHFLCLNLVFMAFMLFDTCVAAAAGRFPVLAIEFGRHFTHVGKSGWILLLAGYIFFAGLARLKESGTGKAPAVARWLTAAAAYMFLTIALSGLTANILKRAIGRARPEFFEQEGIFSFQPFANSAAYESFPSGHATTAAALFVALALLAPHLRTPLLIAGVWIGLARVIVGAHYPSDVIAGLALGAWFALAIATQFARHGILFTITPSGWPQPDYPRTHETVQLAGTLITERT